MKINYKYLFFVTLFFGLVVFSSFIFAQSDLENVRYPIVELGNCGSEEECKVYCEDINNIEVCLNYAGKNNLMSQQEIAEAKKVLPFLKAGTTPGGCETKDECIAYCDDNNNFGVCIKFAKDAGFISDEDYKIAKKTGGVGPGGCKREQCKTYCEDPNNMLACVEFAKQHGLIPPEELENIEKIISYLNAGGKMPGGCKSEESCEAYCETNFGDCIDFAIGAGFISPEDAEMARKTGGKGPGDCKSKEACEAYCNDPDNSDSCLEFAKKHGFISDEEYEMAKKYGGFSGGGPGGCKSKEGCEAYCRENPEACGISSEGEQQIPSEYQGQIPPEYAGQIPPEYQGQIPPEFQQTPPTESIPTPGSAPTTGYVIMRVVR